MSSLLAAQYPQACVCMRSGARRASLAEAMTMIVIAAMMVITMVTAAMVVTTMMPRGGRRDGGRVEETGAGERRAIGTLLGCRAGAQIVSVGGKFNALSRGWAVRGAFCRAEARLGLPAGGTAPFIYIIIIL